MKQKFIEGLTEDFSVRIIKLYKYLQNEQNEFVMSKQILRSGTSVGANVSEAEGGISKKEFRAKMQIALKEIRETKYWLRLFRRTDYISENQFDSIYSDASMVEATLVKIIKGSQNSEE